MEIFRELLEHGQSCWLDSLGREMIRNGELERRVREEGLRGVTSNPAIFHKAISTGSAYDEQIAEGVGMGASVESIYESLVVTDIREACDILGPVYEESAGVDGYVSLEVSPHLVHDTERSLAEARHLWAAVDRPNLMIKIPGTEAGVPAIEELLYEGVNVNVTLLFAVQAYEAVAGAYVRALQRRAAEGRPLESVASVASFFLSRIDVLVDGLLSHRVGAVDDPPPQGLFGRAAVASAKLAYRSYSRLIAGDDWGALAGAGARPQRLLWASTSAKNPLYDPVRYVEPLVGRDTVNTMPEVTIEAFAEGGTVVPNAVESGVEEAEAVFADLAALGIDMDAVSEQLQAEGARKFIDPFDALMAGLARRRGEMLEPRVEWEEPEAGAPGLDPALAALREQRFAARLAARDPSLWTDDAATRESIAERLGWTRGTGDAEAVIAELAAFASEVRDEGIRDVVVLGMGGSSLCPLVASRSFRAGEGAPRLTVLDSVDPAAVARVEAGLDPLATLFVVASKSGGTVETLTLYEVFRDWLEAADVPVPGRHFVAISDPGSPLLERARAEGFRRSFEAPPDVGGRYSALTVFGLLPMALMGADLPRLIAWAREMERESSPALPEAANPAVRFGAALALHTQNGRNKLSLSASAGVAAFPLWVEQLVAESTGKDGRGIVPITGGNPPTPAECSPDRVFAHYAVEGEIDRAGPTLDALAAAGHPVYRFRLPEPEALAGEFVRWEVATATAAALLGVNPFDEPDVAAAKQATRAILDERARDGGRVRAAEGLRVDVSAAGDGDGTSGSRLAAALLEWLGRGEAGGYVSILGYFAGSAEREERIERLRAALRRRSDLPTTFGYGPRYLHSTGQLHKGGPDGGLYLVLTADPVEDLPVPTSDLTLGTLLQAQALGDLDALRERGRPVLHAHLGWYVEEGLETLLRGVVAAG